jgi:hypothetical protein
LNAHSETRSAWSFRRHERTIIIITACVLLAYGYLLERRTALRHAPMTDLGVFCVASGAIWNGGNPYDIADWHGWHYQYPPALAILFRPFAERVPPPQPVLLPGELKTTDNTPWGYPIDGGNYYGLHKENTHFFFSVAVWYLLSVLGILLTAHALACALEGNKLTTPPPEDDDRGRWWRRSLLPLAVCAGSLLTDLSRGQVDILMLTSVSLGLYLVTVRRNVSAGACFAFPATVKMFPPLLLLYPLMRRQWRVAAGIAAGLIILLGILPLVTLGPARTGELYHSWIEVLAKPALGQGTDTSRLRELTGMGSTDNQSLLSTIHNWTYRSQPREERPIQAAPWERYTVYAIGGVMLIATLCLIGFRRADSPHDLLIIAGMLVGVALITSPIVHNFYYLLMLPLVAAFIDLGIGEFPSRSIRWKYLAPILLFMAGDLLARVPHIGWWLRDRGIITVSLLCLLLAGALFLASSIKSRRTSRIA